MTHFIRTNGRKVYLDEESFKDGEFHLAEGTLSEQCEDCGEDIAATGTLYGDGGKDGASVLCDELAGGCGAYFTVEEG